MGYCWLLLDMLKIALDYLEEEAEIAPSEVSEVEITRNFGAVWTVEMQHSEGRCIAFISDSGHAGIYAVYHLHWCDACAVCGALAFWRCSGCKGFFCGSHYEAHLQDNAAYLKGENNV